jgi:DNA repair protein RadC
MAIRMADLPSAERPRERLTRLGPGALSDAELLALVLRSGTRGSNAVEAGSSLVAEHGSLQALSTALVDELARGSGLGPAKTASVVAAFELGRRAALDPDERLVVRSPEDIAAVARRHISHRRREEVFVIVVDHAGRLRHVRKIAEGTADRCSLTPRDVLAAVLRLDAVAIALAHTHPSDDPTPSPADMALTVLLERAASEVGVGLLDHVVVGSRSCSSLRALGILGQRDPIPAS